MEETVTHKTSGHFFPFRKRKDCFSSIKTQNMAFQGAFLWGSGSRTFV